MRILLSVGATLSLAACATVSPPPSNAGAAGARLGERIDVGGAFVTPLKVLEDSRCPAKVQCVWAGRVRLSVKLEHGSRIETHEIATQEPIEGPGGRFSLIEVQPARKTPGTVPAGRYRFAFTFQPGL